MFSGRRTTLTAQLIQRTLLLSVFAIAAILLATAGGGAAVFLTVQRDVNNEGSTAAREFDLFLSSIESDLGAVAGSLFNMDDVDVGFRQTLDRHTEIFELRLVAPNGQVTAQRRRGAVMGEEVVPVQPWIEQTRQGEIYISSVNFAEFGVPFVDVGVGAFDDAENFAGTLVARVDLTALWQRVIGIEVGEQGYAYIVDAEGRLLVYSDLARVREGTNIDNELGLLPAEIENTNPLGLDLMNNYTGLEGELVVGTSVPLQTAPWFAVVEQPVNEAITPFIPAFIALFAALLVSIVLVFTTVQFIRRRVAAPLRGIISGAQTLASGDLSYRIEVQGVREMHDLGTTLNQMAEELEHVNRTLEERVQARTRDLQLAARVSEQISTILDPGVLLPQVVDLTKEYFDLYHAHIYLLDRDGDNLLLRAGAGDVGRVMLERGHRIPASAELSLVARAAREKYPVIVPDTSVEPGFLANPLLPDTRSEAALPLMAGERVLGVLDVQADVPERFDPDLISVLSTMAGQIAVAIDNASMFVEVERSSRHEQALSAVTQAIQGATNMDEVLQVAARELGRALRVPYAAIELQVETEDRDQPDVMAEPGD